MNPQSYIGVSGFMSRAEVDLALAAFPPADRLLMVGVLASSKTLAGTQNNYPRRYPMRDDIAGIFSDDPRCLNLVHYATGGESDPEELADALYEAIRYGGPHCHGLQVNAAWPPVGALREIREHLPDRRIVLQLGPGVLAAGPTVDFVRRLDTYDGAVTDVLIDASGGRGLPIDLHTATRWLCEVGERIDAGRGIAGGLCAEAVPTIADLLYFEEYGVSIDAEGRLRDDADGGGNLDLDKVRRYLAAAGGAIGGGSQR